MKKNIDLSGMQFYGRQRVSTAADKKDIYMNRHKDGSLAIRLMPGAFRRFGSHQRVTLGVDSATGAVVMVPNKQHGVTITRQSKSGYYYTKLSGVPNLPLPMPYSEDALHIEDGLIVLAQKKEAILS